MTTPSNTQSTGTGTGTGTVAVTGAGRGIGLALVEELARRGRRVLATVERQEMAAEVRERAAAFGDLVEVATLDVRDPGEFVFPAHLRVLINNAGARPGYLPLEVASAADFERTFAVNVFGLMKVTQLAIPVLRGAGGGVICNVTSSAVLDVMPFMGVYRASKAAASALCESLRLELAPFGIRVVEAMPGHTLTAMAKDGVISRYAEAIDHPSYVPMAQRQREVNSQLPPFAMPEDAAARIVEAILDVDGPMRYGTDETSSSRLEIWRGQEDEERMRASLVKFGASV